MQKLRCILIDDERKALDALAFELTNFEGRIGIDGQFTSALGALSFLKDHAVDVVFLDVEMPETSGVEFLELCTPYTFRVVFTSAHSQYAINAFKKEATGYLLKPVSQSELEKILVKLEKDFKNNSFERKLEEALSRLTELSGLPKKVKLSFDGKVGFYDPDDILYCKSDGNYCRVYFSNGQSQLLTHKLKNLEDLLPPMYFSRIHHYYIINLSKVKVFHKNENLIELVDNIILPVSRHKKSDMLNIL